MKVNPKSEKEFKERNLMEPGTYDFVVFDAKEKVSKNSGEPMIELVLKVTDLSKRVHTLYDYLMDREPMDYKIRRIYSCADKIEKYESGDVEASDLINVSGKVKISVKKDNKGIYDDRNSVQDYVPYEKQEQLPFDDKLPF